MAKCRLTLRITTATDIDSAVSQLESELENNGIINSALSKLLMNTAERFQTDLLRSGSNSAAQQAPAQGMGDTVIQGEDYRIRITTKSETLLERLLDRVLGRPGSFS